VSVRILRGDISGSMTTGKSVEPREAAERKRAEAREVYQRAANWTPLLDEDSTVEEVDIAAARLKEAMTGTLDELATKRRWCSRSKRWWSEDLKQLRQELGNDVFDSFVVQIGVGTRIAMRNSDGGVGDASEMSCMSERDGDAKM
jgi:hypothetical protein